MIRNNSSLNKVLNSISTYLDSAENVISNIYQSDNYNDYPFFYQYVTEYLPRNGWVEDDLLANGLSLNKEEALVKAVMETIERWYLSDYKEKDLIYDTYFNLQKRNIEAQSPELFSVISYKQTLQRKYSGFVFDQKTNFCWTRVNSIEGDGCFIPAQLVYFMHNNKKKEPTIRLSDSTGAAAGASIEQALLNGICELIERDAYSIVYYNRLSGRKVNLDTILDDKIKSLVNNVQSCHFEVHLIDITLDIKIPVIMCILIDKTNYGPKISVGIKCSLFWQEAVYGAILEALQSLNSTRSVMDIKHSLSKNNFNKIGNAIRPILDRVLFWAEPDSIQKLNFILSSSFHTSQFLEYQQPDKGLTFSEMLLIVRKKLEEVGVTHIYWKQTTPRSMDNFSLFGAKVIIPELQSISLDSKYHYFKGQRLSSVPLTLKLLENCIDEEKLNIDPHPLP